MQLPRSRSSVSEGNKEGSRQHKGMDLVFEGHGICAAWKEEEVEEGRLKGGFREQSTVFTAWRQTAMTHWNCRVLALHLLG